MNMSFGVQTAPRAMTEVNATDPASASSTPNASSTLLPAPAPSQFSAATSGNFTFQGPSGSHLPPSRPPSAPAGFPFPGAPPARFPFANAPPAVPSSAGPVQQFSSQPGFTFQAPGGNPGQGMMGMPPSQPAPAAQNPPLGVRPLPLPVQVSVSAPAPPPQAGSTQTTLPVLTTTPETAAVQAQSMPAGSGTLSEGSIAVSSSNPQVPGNHVRPVTPAPSPLPITNVPGQAQLSASPTLVSGSAAARPGLAPPSAFVQSCPAFTAPVSGAAAVPPGDMKISMCYFAIKGEPSLWPLF